MFFCHGSDGTVLASGGVCVSRRDTEAEVLKFLRLQSEQPGLNAPTFGRIIQCKLDEAFLLRRLINQACSLHARFLFLIGLIHAAAF